MVILDTQRTPLNLPRKLEKICATLLAYSNFSCVNKILKFSQNSFHTLVNLPKQIKTDIFYPKMYLTPHKVFYVPFINSLRIRMKLKIVSYVFRA